jgi:CubicO group peptidase (beta-lactamase class C family)
MKTRNKKPAPATAATSLKPASLDLLDPRLRGLCEAYFETARVPGASVALIAGDKAYHLAHGAISAGQSDAVTLHTGFNIGSCSKAFVSATIASLVGEGLVSWDDPLQRWVPEFQLYDPAIAAMVTLRDVCGNRLGLPRVGFTEYGFVPAVPIERILRGLQHTAPLHPFRQRFTYVNAGHSAAALAAGRITGQGFLPTLRERLLQPLGMSGTSGGVAARDELSQQAGWHVLDGDKLVELPRVYTDHYLGSGGMVVSGADALQWLRLHLGGGSVEGREIVAGGALRETHRPQSIATPGKDVLSLFNPGSHLAAYALGWAVCDLQGEPVVCHSGSDQGVCAYTMLLPRAGIGIAIYANLFTNSVVPLGYALASALLGHAPRDWLAAYAAAGKAIAPRPPARPAAGVQARHPLARYAGAYSHPADGPLRIVAGRSGLSGDMPDGHTMRFRLAPLGGNTFAMQFEELPTRIAMAGCKLEFTFKKGVADSAVMHIPVASATRVFRR